MPVTNKRLWVIKYFVLVYDQCTAKIHIQYTSFGINFSVDSNQWLSLYCIFIAYFYNSFSYFSKTFLNCIQGDHATMHMKELPMFNYNLWMGNCLHPDTPCELLCPVINIAMSNNFKHSHVHFTHFFSNKARFSHTSTVTRLHSFSGKKNTRTPRVHLVFL